jgi:hypothetical protein
VHEPDVNSTPRLGEALVLTPSNHSFPSARSVQPLSPEDQLAFSGDPPPLDVVLESFKNSITQQWQSLVNSYFPTQNSAGHSHLRAQTIVAQQTPVFQTPQVQNIITRTQPTKRRYTEFQEQGGFSAYSAPSKRQSTIPIGDEWRLRLKSPPGTPSLWALPEVRPCGRPKAVRRGYQSIGTIETPQRLSPFHRTLPTNIQREDDEDELVSMGSEELKQEADDSETELAELEMPLDDTATPSCDGFEDVSPKTHHCTDGARDIADDIDLTELTIAQRTFNNQPPDSTQGIEGTREESSVSTQNLKTTTPGLRGGPNRARVDSSREMSGNKKTSRSFITQSRRESVDSVDETDMVTPSSVRSTTRGYIHGGGRMTDRKKKQRTLFIQAVPLAEISLPQTTRPYIAPPILPSCRPIEPQAFTNSPPTSLQAAHQSSKRRMSTLDAEHKQIGVQTGHSQITQPRGPGRPPKATQKPTLEVDAIQVTTSGLESEFVTVNDRAELDRTIQPRRRGRPRKSSALESAPKGENFRPGSVRLELEEAVVGTRIDHDQITQPRRRGRPRKSDPRPGTTVKGSHCDFISTPMDRTVRPRKSDPGPILDIEQQVSHGQISSTPRHRGAGRPYKSPWTLQDDTRLIHVITVQKLSFQKAHRANLFPGKTHSSLVHRYYRVLCGPIKQIKKWSNTSQECRNCHAEFIPAKKTANGAPDPICAACSLKAKGHGGEQHPPEHDSHSIT